MPQFSSKSKKLFDGQMEPKLGEELPASAPKPKVKKTEDAPPAFTSGPPSFNSKNKNNFEVLKSSPAKQQESPEQPAPKR